MYVNYYDRKVKLDDENNTIGIILCKDKKQSIVEMTLPENNNQIFASKYQTVLPSKEELQHLLNEEQNYKSDLMEVYYENSIGRLFLWLWNERSNDRSNITFNDYCFCLHD